MARRNPPVGTGIPGPWVLVSPPPPVALPMHGNHYEVYLSPRSQTVAVLRLVDSWPGIAEDEILRRLEDGDSWWVAFVRDPQTGHWYDVAEKGTYEDLQIFDTRREALYRASMIDADILNARVGRRPDWAREDIAAYMQWFVDQVPNRVDYVRLFRSNDPNGTYDGLLIEPVRVSEEAFEQIFEDVLPASNPAAVAQLAVVEGRLAAVEGLLVRNPCSPEAARLAAECRAEITELRAELGGA